VGTPRGENRDRWTQTQGIGRDARFQLCRIRRQTVSSSVSSLLCRDAQKEPGSVLLLLQTPASGRGLCPPPRQNTCVGAWRKPYNPRYIAIFGGWAIPGGRVKQRAARMAAQDGRAEIHRCPRFSLLGQVLGAPAHSFGPVTAASTNRAAAILPRANVS